MDYVLDKLKKIEDLDERKKEAERLCKVFYDEMPEGSINPNIFWYNGPSDDDVLKFLDYDNNYYKQMKELLGEILPDSLLHIFEDYQKNSEHCRYLLSLDTSGRRENAPHGFFPFWPDFNKAIKKLYSFNPKEFDIESIDFNNKGNLDVIGRGGSAILYKGIAKDGKEYALKLFYPSFMIHCNSYPEIRRINAFIKENIRSQKDLSFEYPFIPIHAISKDRDTMDDFMFCYIEDYFSGQSLGQMIYDNLEISQQTKALSLLVYTQMLEKLHNKKKLFLDNNLEGILINNDKIRICDIDMIADIDKLKDGEYYPYHNYAPSREQVLGAKPGYSSDMEGLALMAHYLIFKKQFIGGIHVITKDERSKRYEISSRDNKKMAELNKRGYPSYYYKKLPKHLREIIPELIRYPRNDSISASDFASAVKQDFKII